MHDVPSYLGRHQTKPIDAEDEKRTGWRRHGILVVAEQDPRLTWPERELVRQLGAKLYGATAGGRPMSAPDQAEQGPRSRARGGPRGRSRRPAGAPLSGHRSAYADAARGHDYRRHVQRREGLPSGVRYRASGAAAGAADAARPRHGTAFGTERVPARCPASRTRSAGRIGRAIQSGGLLRVACGRRRAQPSRLGVAPVLEWPPAAPGPCAGHPGRGPRHPGSPDRPTAPRSRAGLISATRDVL